MFKVIKSLFLRNIISITACVCGVVVLILASNAQAAKPGFSCQIQSPANGSTFPAGATVDFQGKVSNGTTPYAIHWAFGDGNTFDETGTKKASTSTPSNTYPSPASDTQYQVTLDATDDNGNGVPCAQQSITITIQAGGGGNCVRNAPTFSMGADQAIDANDGSAVYTLSVTNNDTAACANTLFSLANSDTGDTGSFDPSSLSAPSVSVAPGATDTTVTLTVTGNGTGAGGDALTSTVTVSDNTDHNGQDQSDSVTTTIANNTPIARGDTYATPAVGPSGGSKQLDVAASRVSGVLYNDFGGEPPLTAQLVSGPANAASFTLNADGSFTYTPDATLADNDNDSFTYIAVDSLGVQSDPATVNINILSDQPDYKIMMNYELGMHCTGFEFAYCCVLPPYNSILAQVVKPQATSNPDSGDDFPRLLEGSHEVGTDGLGRPTVVQAGALDGNGDYQTYMLEYFHDA
ncbi:MAG: PKD domain-containing protein, partial [Thiogranum sp.]